MVKGKTKWDEEAVFLVSSPACSHGSFPSPGVVATAVICDGTNYGACTDARKFAQMSCSMAFDYEIQNIVSAVV